MHTIACSYSMCLKWPSLWIMTGSGYLNALHTCFPWRSSSTKHIIDILIRNIQTGLFSRLFWLETLKQPHSPNLYRLAFFSNIKSNNFSWPLMVFFFSLSPLRFTFQIGPRFTSEEGFKPRWQPAIKLRLKFSVKWESGCLSLANYSVWWQQCE